MATVNVIEYVTIASLGNATDFGDLTASTDKHGACSDGTKCTVAGGTVATYTDTIQYFNIASTGNASDFGDLTTGKGYVPGVISDGTKGVLGGGRVVPGANVNTIDYWVMASLGNASDFGDLTETIYAVGGTSGDTS